MVNGIVTFTGSMRRTEGEFIYRDRAAKREAKQRKGDIIDGNGDRRKKTVEMKWSSSRGCRDREKSQNQRRQSSRGGDREYRGRDETAE